MINIKVKLYQYSELSEEAKKFALYDYRREYEDGITLEDFIDQNGDDHVFFETGKYFDY